MFSLLLISILIVSTISINTTLKFFTKIDHISPETTMQYIKKSSFAAWLLLKILDPIWDVAYFATPFVIIFEIAKFLFKI